MNWTSRSSRLISERAEAASAIGELKRNADSPSTSPTASRTSSNTSAPSTPARSPDAEILHVYERIMDVMRTLQRRDVS